MFILFYSSYPDSRSVPAAHSILRATMSCPSRFGLQAQVYEKERAGRSWMTIDDPQVVMPFACFLLGLGTVDRSESRLDVKPEFKPWARRDT